MERTQRRTAQRSLNGFRSWTGKEVQFNNPNENNLAKGLGLVRLADCKLLQSCCAAPVRRMRFADTYAIPSSDCVSDSGE